MYPAPLPPTIRTQELNVTVRIITGQSYVAVEAARCQVWRAWLSARRCPGKLDTHCQKDSLRIQRTDEGGLNPRTGSYAWHCQHLPGSTAIRAASQHLLIC